MLNKLFVIVFSILTFSNCLAQSIKCNCTGLINPAFKGAITLLDSPGGKVINTFYQDSAHDIFFVFNIKKDSSNYFQINLNLATSTQAYSGWIEKANFIGTHARNYSPEDTLQLYEKANINSNIKSIVLNWNNDWYQITSCNKSWVYVKLNLNGTIKEGWLDPEMQCNNPFTTCN